MPASSQRRATHARRLSQARDGQTMVMVALGFVLLLTCVALAVDGARLYAEGLRVQKAADQAALAGVTQVSNGTDNTTLGSIVTPLVNRNLPLIRGASLNTTPTLTQGTTNQLKVQVQESGFPLFFAPIFGFKSATIAREATAQYNAPVPMGNPTGTLGDSGQGDGNVTIYKPSDTGAQDSGSAVNGGTATAVVQNMKLSINGPDTLVENGDPYSPLYVLSDSPFVSSGTPIVNPFRAQATPAFNGYDYKVTINSPGYTYIQVYDAGTCQGTFNDLASGQGFGVPNLSGGFSQGNSNYATFYSLYSYNSATNQKTPVTGPINGALTLGRELNLDPVLYNYPVIIAPTENCNPAYKARWYTLAEINSSTAGSTYIVNVSTCLAQRPYATGSLNDRGNIDSTSTSSPPACYGSELNNFALRAVTTTTSRSSSCFASDGSGDDSSHINGNKCQTMSNFSATGLATSQPTLGGIGRISVEVNSGATGQSVIYLAHIDQTYRGKWLMVKLFDPGDVVGASSLQIVRPDGTYAPFMWYTQTLDGYGKPFTTAMRNISDVSGNMVNRSLTTSTVDHTYSLPSGGCNQVSDGSLSVARAYGQTMGEDNPFDTRYQVSGCAGTNAAVTDSNRQWNQGTFPSTDYTQYNYDTVQGGNYAPFNGRWVYMFTQIPSDYTGGPTTGPNLNPNPGWWYVQYKTANSNFSDRTTWEASIIDTPPHLVN